MAESKKYWKRGRGKLGLFAPLLGGWKAETESPMGPLACTRHLAPVLGGAYIQLNAHWQFGTTAYEEHALIGVKADGCIAFWSFTSDGKSSNGVLADVTDVHPEAIGFEAQMPAGLARMVYWPDSEGGFHWAVESRNKKGWRRFTEHHYTKL